VNDADTLIEPPTVTLAGVTDALEVKLGAAGAEEGAGVAVGLVWP
jgi:hypothetical protein